MGPRASQGMGACGPRQPPAPCARSSVAARPNHVSSNDCPWMTMADGDGGDDDADGAGNGDRGGGGRRGGGNKDGDRDTWARGDGGENRGQRFAVSFLMRSVNSTRVDDNGSVENPWNANPEAHGRGRGEGRDGGGRTVEAWMKLGGVAMIMLLELPIGAPRRRARGRRGRGGPGGGAGGGEGYWRGGWSLAEWRWRCCWSCRRPHPATHTRPSPPSPPPS